jgi:tetratricopeptide (TPR) repeat protein
MGGFGLAFAVLFSGCGGVMSQVSETFERGRRAQVSYDHGLKLYQAKDYAGAIPQFQRALAYEPAFDDAEAHLAWSYYHVGKYPQATRHFRQAIARQPRWEGLYNGLGWSRNRVGRYHLAIEAFQQALEIDPRYREAAVGLAYSLFELGRYAEALPRLERLTREGEGHALQSPTRDVEEVRSRLAWTLYYVGQYDRAREEFTKGIAARPHWYGLHNGLGWTSLKLGDRGRAQASFQRALQLKSDFADAREGLAQAKR